MKNILLALSFAFILTGCINTSIGFRSVITSTSQESSTDGKIENQPKSGSSSIDAAKTTDFSPNTNVNDSKSEDK